MEPTSTNRTAPWATVGQYTLTDAERQLADRFSHKIDLWDPTVPLRYGIPAQKKIAALSDSILTGTRTAADSGQDPLPRLIDRLKATAAPLPSKSAGRLFAGETARFKRWKKTFSKAQAEIDDLLAALERQENQLLEDMLRLEKLFSANQRHCKELTLYIAAGRLALQRQRTEVLLPLQIKAQSSDSEPEIQSAQDFAVRCDRFEKRLYDLELTRAVSLQMIPQLRLLQNDGAALAKKLRTILGSTVPLWKNQIALAWGVAQTQQATDDLVAALDETLALRDTGARTDAAATAALRQLETELKTIPLEPDGIPDRSAAQSESR